MVIIGVINNDYIPYSKCGEFKLFKFQYIQNNPITTLKSVCRKLKINVDDKASKNLKKWIYKKKNDSPDMHKYSYSRYGVSKSVVEKKFQFYDDKKYINN